jgi:hypothetical protein
MRTLLEKGVHCDQLDVTLQALCLEEKDIELNLIKLLLQYNAPVERTAGVDNKTSQYWTAEQQIKSNITRSITGLR